MKLDMAIDNDGIPRNQPLDAKPPTVALMSRHHHCLYVYLTLVHCFVFQYSHIYNLIHPIPIRQAMSSVPASLYPALLTRASIKPIPTSEKIIVEDRWRF